MHSTLAYHWLMSARCSSKANGLPGKPTHELGCGIRNAGPRSRRQQPAVDADRTETKNTIATKTQRTKKNSLEKIISRLLVYNATVMVRLAGIEPTTPWFVAKYSIQLSYSRQALYCSAIICHQIGVPPAPFYAQVRLKRFFTKNTHF